MRFFILFAFLLSSCSKNFKPEEPTIVKTDKLTIYYLPDPELPLIKGALYIPGGSLWEDVPGSTELMGSLLSSGGVKGLSPLEFERKLKEFAAEISTSFGEEYGTVSFSSLSDDFDPVFDLFISVITEPAFDVSRFELLKSQSIDGIRRRKDNPDTVARIIYKTVMFADSPFGRSLTSEQVRSINHESILKRYRELVTPEGAILVITGDLNLKKAELVAQKLEERWNSFLEKDLTPPKVLKPIPGVYFVEMDTKQASVFIGEHSLPRGHSDRFKVEVFNNIFGFGGFGSRLMQSVRSKSGLAYNVYGGTTPGLVVGSNIIGFQTKNESVGEALKLSISELERLQQELVSDEELKRNQDSLINSFIFRFETPEATLGRRAAQRMLNVPESFDSDYVSLIPKVSVEDVRQVANRWWSSENFIIAVAGNRDALKSIKNEFPSLPIFEGRFNEVFYLQ